MLDVFLLLYDIPKNRETHRTLKHNLKFSTTILCAIIDSIKNDGMRDAYCEKYKMDATIASRTANKTSRNICNRIVTEW